MDIDITPNGQPVEDGRLAEILANPGFGAHFTDHMLTVQWTSAEGWHDARITPYGPLALDPAAAILHYAQQTFEGMKAYRHPDGSIWSFRPEENANRMIRSCRRLALPALPADEFIQAVDALVELDQRWVPEPGESGEKSLYVRPFMFASETGLAVKPAERVTFMVIAGPAGAYFSSGVKPVALWLTEEYTRAGRGGMGAAKTGGNYASSLVAQQEAMAHGCGQVVFLDGQEGRYVEELGGMNLYFVLDDGSIVTPGVGTILEGITRASVIELAEKMGHPVIERKFAIDEWKDGITSGRITEIFACGTAAVITPVGTLTWSDGELPAPPSTELTMRIRQALVDVQFGRTPDTFGWLHRIG